MHLIGKIDRELYRCITDQIVTEDVIITTNQMQHILERHPEVYAKVVNYFESALKHCVQGVVYFHEVSKIFIKR